MTLTAQVVSIIVGPLLAVYVVMQLRQIHVLVNSNLTKLNAKLTKVTTRLSKALDEIERLGGEEEKF
jgi:hypothetical protein